MKKACLQEVPGISVLILILVLSLADCKSERKKGPAGTGTSVSEKGEAAPSAERAAGKRRFRKPSRFYAHGPSSLLKVEAAEREGKLDAEKALICRFMALFDPGKLSAEYRSLSPIPCGTSVLRAFRKAKDTLSPETLETLKPYLVRPSDPQSIFARRIAGMKKQASSPPLPGSGLLFAQIDPAGERPENNPRLPDWYGAASTSAPLTVWSCASYAEARKALAFVDGHKRLLPVEIHLFRTYEIQVFAFLGDRRPFWGTKIRGEKPFAREAAWHGYCTSQL